MAYQYANPEHTVILVDGKMSVPVDPLNREYRKIPRNAVISAYQAPAPAAPTVRELRTAALDALLEKEAAAVDAPKALKDYAAAKA